MGRRELRGRTESSSSTRLFIKALGLPGKGGVVAQEPAGEDSRGVAVDEEGQREWLEDRGQGKDQWPFRKPYRWHPQSLMMDHATAEW